ncbi:DUF1294 domain-containing protein [Halobacillus sp. Marseille-Q1614]|uniref:DUF1294 domain-containing protein n=1 Tax=Halobacillus sp. Marseille-Q1614 TaxID=2709134 RepID=UPI0020C247DF|nr:DUF1294 domain-containing protein [Halobacillus sp. Marseille-Q1614]
METAAVTLLIIMSLIQFLLMGYDKKQARERKWRISEKTLWLLALFGGAAGAAAGMQVFRHKTKHTSFVIGMPLLAGLHIYAIFAADLF